MKVIAEGYFKADNMNKSKTIELAGKAIKGDVNAFDTLYKDRTLKMLYFANNILGDYHEAQDAVQEAVVLMYKNISNLSDPSNYDAWLYKILKNVCNGMLRKKIKKDEQIKEDEFFVNETEDDLDFIPKEFLENQEMKTALSEALDKLPPKRRLALSMYYFDEMSYEEISYAMEVSVATVGTNISRGKKQLKSILENDKRLDSEVYSKGYGAVALGPALNEMFLEDANGIFSPEIIESVQISCKKSISTLSLDGKTLLKNKYSGIKTAVAVIVITFGLVTAILVNVQPGSNSSSYTDTPTENVVQSASLKGNLAFSGGDCECGHVNPTSVHIQDFDEEIRDVSWRILDSSGEVLYSGAEYNEKIPFKKMYKNKFDGVYTIEYIFNSDNYEDVTLTRKFRIDTGDIQPGQYG